jgi:hypothetical protein
MKVILGPWIKPDNNSIGRLLEVVIKIHVNRVN